MVAKYYGQNYSAQELRERTQIGKDGVNLLGISEAAESIGFLTRLVVLKVMICNVQFTVLHKCVQLNRILMPGVEVVVN
jgi:ABC-type bacteriocin/lantibiotic exporter with double-glycine peptidase domain